MAEEVQEKKQKPEKPKKAGGEMDLKKILIVVGIVMIAQVIIIVVLFQTVLAPSSEEGNEKEKEKEKVVKEGEEEEEEIDGEHNPLYKYAEIKDFNIVTKNLDYIIQIQLGLKVKIILKEGEEPPAEEGGGHGAAPAAFAFSDELVAEAKSKLNVFLGSMSMEDINKFSRDSIRSLIKIELKPLFKKNKYLLKDVMLVNFTPVKP